MPLGELHMTNCQPPDYTAPHCHGNGDCEKRKRCMHYLNTGEPAAFWARRDADGTCPHYVEAVL